VNGTGRDRRQAKAWAPDEPGPGPSLSRRIACNLMTALVVAAGWLAIFELFGVGTTPALFAALLAGIVRIACIEIWAWND
jgi:hypothetical protein